MIDCKNKNVEYMKVHFPNCLFYSDIHDFVNFEIIQAFETIRS